MSLFSIDMRCPGCDLTWDTLVERSDPDPTEVCARCGDTGRRTINSVTPLRASHQMGYRRGAAYEDIKAAARLKAERANLPQGEARADINKEIAAREQSAGKQGTKTQAPTKKGNTK